MTSKELIFLAQVKMGMHPDWMINHSGELIFVGEMPTSSEQEEYEHIQSHPDSKEE